MVGMHLFPARHGGPVGLLAALLLLGAATGLVAQPALAGGGPHGKHHKAKIAKSRVYKAKSSKRSIHKIKPHKVKAFRPRAPRPTAPVSRSQRATWRVTGAQPVENRRQVAQGSSHRPSKAYRITPRAQPRPAPPRKRVTVPKRIETRRELMAHLRPEPKVPRAELERFQDHDARPRTHRSPQRLRHKTAGQPSRPVTRRTPQSVPAVSPPLPKSHRQPIQTDSQNRQRFLQAAHEDRPASTVLPSSAVSRAAIAKRSPHATARKQPPRVNRRVRPERHPFSSHTRRLTMWERRTGHLRLGRQPYHAAHASPQPSGHRAVRRARHHARPHHRIRHERHWQARHHRHHRHHHRLAHGYRHHHLPHTVIVYSYFPVFHPLYGWYDPWPRAIFAYYGHWPGWIYDLPPWLRWRFWIAHYRLYGGYPHEYCPHHAAVLAYLGYAGDGDYDDDDYDDAFAYANYDDGNYGYGGYGYDEDGDDRDDDCPDDD